LYANDEVRPATLSARIFASEFSSSSVKPSEKYSLSRDELMSTNGSTAILGPATAGSKGRSRVGGDVDADSAAVGTVSGTNLSPTTMAIVSTSNAAIAMLSLRPPGPGTASDGSMSDSRLIPSGVSS
jgi:hypothetical protein